ncbi:hypothetical protein R1sor_002764 [Riccia sorocarpa]|uniref:Uncharacterized protein n=1 Tax=Riccia sorocarpa TaxID=122646 RepID=A0ABD3H2T1_9MARC
MPRCPRTLSFRLGGSDFTGLLRSALHRQRWLFYPSVGSVATHSPRAGLEEYRYVLESRFYRRKEDRQDAEKSQNLSGVAGRRRDVARCRWQARGTNGGIYGGDPRESFPIFVQATEEFVKELESPLCEDDLEALLGCAANSFAEIVPSRKHFAVYRAVTFFLGFKEHTQLPEGLEEAIK